MTHHRQIKEKLHIDSMATSVYTWQKKSDEESPGAQIDMIMERADRIVHLCEIKFSENKYVITKDYEMKLRERAGIFNMAAGNDYGYRIVAVILKRGVSSSLLSNDTPLFQSFRML